MGLKLTTQYSLTTEYAEAVLRSESKAINNSFYIYILKGEKLMKTWECSICGYVHQGDTPPEKCPICKMPAEKFEEKTED